MYSVASTHHTYRTLGAINEYITFTHAWEIAHFIQIENCFTFVSRIWYTFAIYIAVGCLLDDLSEMGQIKLGKKSIIILFVHLEKSMFMCVCVCVISIALIAYY